MSAACRGLPALAAARQTRSTHTTSRPTYRRPATTAPWSKFSVNERACSWRDSEKTRCLICRHHLQGVSVRSGIFGAKRPAKKSRPAHQRDDVQGRCTLDDVSDEGRRLERRKLGSTKAWPFPQDYLQPVHTYDGLPTELLGASMTTFDSTSTSGCHFYFEKSTTAPTKTVIFGEG